MVTNIKIKWFNSHSDSKESLKKRYHELVQKYHPDIVGHDTDEIREINSEYDLLYSIILNGGELPPEVEAKAEPASLIAYHIGLFIRNKFMDEAEYIAKQLNAEKNFGRFIFASREEIYHGWMFGTEVKTKTIYVENPPKDMRSGFYACEFAERKICDDTLDIQVARIIPGKVITPASLDDIYNLIMHGKGKWDSYKVQDHDSWFGHQISRHSSEIGLTDRIYTATCANYGDIVYTINTSKSSRYVACVTLFFMMDGVMYQTDVIEKQLGPLNDVQEYSPEDIVMLHKFGHYSHALFDTADFSLPPVCHDLKFTSDDLVKDWPLDPVLSRYARLGVIKVYRHGYQMAGHFDGRELYRAIVRNQIDLEDFDLCQDQFDSWYNDCLDKYKRDIKKGRIKLKI